jgi:putative acetyltransferase
MQVNVRSATNADVDAVKRLVYRVLREYKLNPEPDGTDADLLDIETNYIKRGGLFEILADENDALLGTVGLYPINNEIVELRKMYFDPILRGQGYGKQTLERMIKEARQRGFKKIYLETNSVLKEAISLYQRFGFAPTAEKHALRCDQAFILDLENESTAL